MIRPIFMIYKFFQTKTTVEIWLYDNTEMRIQGKIIGFDEYMNIVLSDGIEIVSKKNQPDQETKRKIGRIMLKGENIAMICNPQETE